MLPFIHVVKLMYKDNNADPALHFKSMAFKHFPHQNSVDHSFSVGMICLQESAEIGSGGGAWHRIISL